MKGILMAKKPMKKKTTPMLMAIAAMTLMKTCISLCSVLSGAAVPVVALDRRSTRERLGHRLSQRSPGDIAEECAVAGGVHDSGTAALRKERAEKGEVFGFERAAIEGGEHGAQIENGNQ